MEANEIEEDFIEIKKEISSDESSGENEIEIFRNNI